MVKRKNIKANSRYWTVILVIVTLIGLFGAVYAGIMSANNIKTSLAQRTQGLADLIPPEDIQSLEGSEADLQLPVYQSLKERLVKVHHDNKDIRFVYIMGQRGGQAFFYVDSENPDSDDYSPPGQAYEDVHNDVERTYQTGQSEVLPIEKDDYGTWLTGFSPIVTNDGQVVGVMGLDIPARNYYVQIGQNSAIAILLTSLIILMVLWARRRIRFQQQFLAEKAYFLSFASHEIRSPLTSVAWALDKITSKEKVKGQKQSLEEIQNNLQHILSTVDDVLSLQGMERMQSKKLHKHPVAIHPIIEAGIASLDLMSREHSIVIKDLTATEDKQIIGLVDELLFKRVITNLTVNSIKYAPGHTTVEIALSQTDHHWMVSIHNEGPGISPADQKKIFEGFYRTKQAEASKQKGSGFGLMLCRDIIVSHGGRIELESKKDHGVTFKLILPK